jgi:cytochrome P450
MTGSGNAETTPAEGNTVSAARVTDLNPVSPENLLNPIPFYTTLRETDPVHWSDELHGWLLTRHDDVMNCFRDSRMSANRIGVLEYQLRDLGTDVLRDFIEIVRKQMMMWDGAHHIRMRRQSNPSFTPQALDSWRPAIRRIMHLLLDRVQHQGRMDLVPSISYEMPPRVIAELFGIPEEQHDILLKWAEPIAQFGGLTVGMDVMTVARRANTAMKEFAQYLIERVEERRQAPGNDLLSRMLPALEEGALTLDEVVANTILMLTAGHMTSTDQLSNAVHDLLSHPDQLQLLRDDPTLLQSAVEESLRYHASVPFHFRIAAEDISLRGRTIRKGDMVFLGIGAANRDPAVFSDPDRFDITRDFLHQKHLTFSFGPHHCLGAGLARRELEIALEMLLQRLPGLRLDEEHPPQPKCQSLIFSGFTSLPVRW